LAENKIWTLIVAYEWVLDEMPSLWGLDAILLLVMIICHYLIGQKDQKKRKDANGIIVDMLAMGRVKWMGPEMHDFIWMKMHD
jgi:hypothetical protein